MNFSIPTELLDLQHKTRTFIAEQIIPFETDAGMTAHGPTEKLRQQLLAKSRSEGLLTPHASVEMGGLGLSHIAKALSLIHI